MSVASAPVQSSSSRPTSASISVRKGSNLPGNRQVAMKLSDIMNSSSVKGTRGGSKAGEDGESMIDQGNDQEHDGDSGGEQENNFRYSNLQSHHNNNDDHQTVMSSQSAPAMMSSGSGDPNMLRGRKRTNQLHPSSAASVDPAMLQRSPSNQKGWTAREQVMRDIARSRSRSSSRTRREQEISVEAMK
jgi:hypothetical protein